MRLTDIVEHVMAGRKVLFMALSADHRDYEMHRLADMWHGFVKDGRRLRDPGSNGFVDFVLSDHDCLGIQYDVAATPVTNEMSIRVAMRPTLMVTRG